MSQRLINPVPDSWSFLEERINELAHFERLCPSLDGPERVKYAVLVEVAARMAGVYSTSHSDIGNSIGLTCASVSAMERSYMFSLMTADSVIQARKKHDGPVTMVELGMGSGINCIAALLAEPDTRIIAYENNDPAINFAKILFDLYGVSARVEIRHEDFLKTNMKGITADVVVNENIDSMLIGGPQLEASQAIFPHTHRGTLFVPGGFDVYVSGNGLRDGKPIYFGRIDLSSKFDSPLVLSQDFGPGELPKGHVSVDCLTALLNPRMEDVLRANTSNLEQLLLSTLSHIYFSGIDSNADNTVHIVFEFPSPYPKIFPERRFYVRRKGEPLLEKSEVRQGTGLITRTTPLTSASVFYEIPREDLNPTDYAWWFDEEVLGGWLRKENIDPLDLAGRWGELGSLERTIGGQFSYNLMFRKHDGSDPLFNKKGILFGMQQGHPDRLALDLVAPRFEGYLIEKGISYKKS